MRLGRRPRRATGAPPARARGFTLLEAVVALVVFAAAGGALYGLFSTNLLALARSGDVAAQTPVVRHALAHLAAVNPWQQQQGELAVEGFDVAWRAQLAAPVRTGQTAFGSGDYDLALYDVEIEVFQQGQRLGVWRTRLVGHHKVRGLDLLPPG